MTGAVDDLLAEVADDDGPGVAIGIYRDGALVSAALRGRACLEHAVPIGSRTRFDLASVSKQMTAGCALLLHRDRVVDLDADARTWLPELRPGGVTLRHCLHHTSGLPDYEEVTALRGDPLAALATLPQLLGWLAAVDRTHFPPGSDICYSNTGYVAVAAALSRAAGRPFAELMRTRVFGPLGMTETVLHDTIGLVVPGMAFSYDTEPVGHLRREMPEQQVGDGAVLSHLEDLAGWHGFLVDGRGLGADVRRQLVEPAVLADGRPTRYAAGVVRHAFEGHDLLSHAGSMHAYRSSLLSVPARGLGVTVLSNRGGIDAYSLGLEVLRGCLHHVPDESRPRHEPPLPERRWICPATGEVLRSATGADDGAGERHVQDELGRRKRFLPVADDPPHDVTVPAGHYHGATLGPVEVRRQGNTSLITVGRRPPAVLIPTVAYGGDGFFRVSVPQSVWVRWRPEDCSLTVSTGGAAHLLTPRHPAGGDGPVSRPGGGPAAPPIPR